MTINGTNTKDWGLIPYKITGHMNMPSRFGNYLYDWGDEWEPLFGPNYTSWTNRTFIVDFVFDPNVQTISTTLDAWVQNYKTASELTVAFDNGVGSHQVYLEQVRSHLKYVGGRAKIQIAFREPVPAFPGVIPSNSSDILTIDGKGLNAFSCVLSRFQESTLGQILNSAETVYNRAQKARGLRNPATVIATIYCTSNHAQNIANLQKVLSQDKILPVEYNGNNFNVICAQGFTATKAGRDAYKIELQLLRL